MPSLASELGLDRGTPLVGVACDMCVHLLRPTSQQHHEVRGTEIAISQGRKQAQRGDVTGFTFHTEKLMSLALDLDALFY